MPTPNKRGKVRHVCNETAKDKTYANDHLLVRPDLLHGFYGNNNWILWKTIRLDSWYLIELSANAISGKVLKVREASKALN